MGQALYRKYRSQSLSEIVGQEHITKALEQALKTGRISHAYLFTGPRGSGKTSIARILAHAINDLPYSSEPNLDIIEIDAASNRRIDEIRELRDKVYIAPTSAKYKVYIIDEVHMLTREAFNALLKTLEEPPEHVVFMLATTDAHKLPETIISRTQRYTFRPVEANKVAEHLAHIAKQEKIKADQDALLLLAQHGDGSFRDSISMLDQASNHGDKVTLEAVRSQLGIPPQAAIQTLIASLSGNDLSAPISALQQLYNDGYRAVAIASELSKQLRIDLGNNSSAVPPATLLPLLKQLLEVGSTHHPEHFLELTLMEAITPAAPANQSSQPVPVSQPAATNEPSAKVPKPEPVATKVEPVAAKATKAKTPKAEQRPLDEASWADVLATLKKQYNTIYGIVRMAHVDLSEAGTVSLSFAFAFHQKRISDPKNRKIVTDTIEEVTGQAVELQCSVSKEPKPRPAVNTDNALEDISNVFGGGELLQS